MSVVTGRKNPFLGALVSAEIVVTDPDVDFRNEILEICRHSLPMHKVPAIIRCVSALEVASAGKLVRHHA
jgi:acyl-CoA synthetase (AMP-forming)/AMP-acid ligase II